MNGNIDLNQLTVTTFSELPIIDDEDRAFADVQRKVLDPDDPRTCEIQYQPDWTFRQRRRLSFAPKYARRRMIYKNGDCNISNTNIRKRRRRYLADIFTTLVDIKWRYTLLLFMTAFIVSWVLFAVAWYLIGYVNGDLEKNKTANHKDCVEQVHNFVTALLFSIETQHTIGYGSRHTTEHCHEAILLMMLQSVVGVIIQALMTGIVFAKLSRPKKRAETLMFSKKALVCERDGKYCLMFRVGDMRKSHIIDTHVRGLLIKKRITREGEVDPLHQLDVNLGFNDGTDRLFLVWPIIITHIIDENSPFWNISAETLKYERFELVILLEGIVESTGMTTQARTSYLPSEMLWGHRFKRLVTYEKEDGTYQIDYSRFHDTVKMDDMPQYSAAFHENYREDSRSLESSNTQLLPSITLPPPRFECGNNNEIDGSTYKRSRFKVNTITPDDAKTECSNVLSHNNNQTPYATENEHDKTAKKSQTESSNITIPTANQDLCIDIEEQIGVLDEPHSPLISSANHVKANGSTNVDLKQELWVV